MCFITAASCGVALHRPHFAMPNTEVTKMTLWWSLVLLVSGLSAHHVCLTLNKPSHRGSSHLLSNMEELIFSRIWPLHLVQCVCVCVCVCVCLSVSVILVVHIAFGFCFPLSVPNIVYPFIIHLVYVDRVWNARRYIAWLQLDMDIASICKMFYM